MPLAPPSEEPTRAHAAGELDRATAAVIRELGPGVAERLRAMLRSEGAVDEAFSRWAENVWRGLASFGGRSSIRTWARRIAHNAALDVREEARRRGERAFFTGELSRLAAPARSSTAERYERARRALDELRATLSPPERVLLELRVNRGLRWAEIAALLSQEGEPVDRATVMKRFERLKGRLARRARALGLLG